MNERVYRVNDYRPVSNGDEEQCGRFRGEIRRANNGEVFCRMYDNMILEK